VGFYKKTSFIFWLSVSLTGIAIIITSLLYNRSAVMIGFSMRRVIVVDSILFLSGLMSGLSGFGFSAIGAAGLIFLPPILGVPLLQALSMANQLLSVGLKIRILHFQCRIELNG
jgi:hypothetical protein